MRNSLALVLLLPSLALAQVPTQYGYQGRLLAADGTPESGTHALTFRVFSTPTGGSPLWSETHVVALTDGFYAVLLGSKEALGTTVFDGADRFLEIEVGGETLSPRQAVASVPYAAVAGQARTVTGSVAVTSATVGGQPVLTGVSVNAPLSGDGTTGAPLGLPQASASIDGYLGSADWAAFDAKVSAITAGSGASITGPASTPTISVAFGTSAGTAAAGNDPRLSDARAPTAGSGHYLQNQSAAPQPASFNISGSGQIGGGLTVGGQPVLTGVSSAAPLAGDGTAASPLALPAATASTSGYLRNSDWALFQAKVTQVVAGAGAAVSGPGTTPMVSVVYGTTPGTAAAGNDPRLSDARAPTAGSAHYLQNQGTTPQAASFNVSGTGRVGGDLTVGGQVRGLRVENAAAPPFPCTAAQAGAIYFDTSTRMFRGCDGSAFVNLNGP